SKQLGKTDVDVVYSRLSIDVLAHLPPEMIGEIVVDSLPLSIRQSLDEINQALGLDLVPEEVEDLIFYDKRDAYPVRIKEDASLAWLPSEINVRVAREQLLSLVWPIHHLDGLHP